MEALEFCETRKEDFEGCVDTIRCALNISNSFQTYFPRMTYSQIDTDPDTDRCAATLKISVGALALTKWRT